MSEANVRYFDPNAVVCSECGLSLFDPECPHGKDLRKRANDILRMTYGDAVADLYKPPDNQPKK